MPVTVYPIGTTIYDPEKSFNGYTIICIYEKQEPIKLIDMNGNTIKKWNLGGRKAERGKLLKNGNIITVETSSPKNNILEYSWNDILVWEYEANWNTHHDVQRLSNGNTLLLCQEFVPKKYRENIQDPKRRKTRQIISDLILEVTPEKEIVWEWHMYKYIDINKYCKIYRDWRDWTHTNTVHALPENKWYDAGDERFRPGNILLSPRNLGFIFIVDKYTKEIVWEYSGNYAGGLAGQHEPNMIMKGLPGEGNIIVFDNGAPPLNDCLAHAGQSFILEIEPPTTNIKWAYSNAMKFYSTYASTVQRLSNGNTFICESQGPRLFEVTRKGEIVWEYTVEWHCLITRAYRYSYDFCPQLNILRKPHEKKVTPPKHVRTYGKTKLFDF
jgi:hypothetical protein